LPLTPADASFTRTRHVVCGVLTADCLPVLLAHRDGQAVGVAHAGWRGMAGGVIEATLAQMGVAAAEVLAYLGPAISQPAFEVGQDVYEAFVNNDKQASAAFAPAAAGKFHADLYALASLRLAQAGVHDIYGGGYCTYTHTQRVYPYRRDHSTVRMSALSRLDVIITLV